MTGQHMVVFRSGEYSSRIMVIAVVSALFLRRLQQRTPANFTTVSPFNHPEQKENTMQPHQDHQAVQQGQSDVFMQGAVVAVYDTHQKAEEAIMVVQKSGFEMKQLSIVGKDYQTEEEVVGYYNTGDRMMAWGKSGAFWGSIWGLMFGSAFFLIPGVGPLLAAGPLVGWIVGALEGAVVGGGLSALGAGLFGIGIPENSVIQYETQIKAGKFVVIAHGSADEVSKIRGVLDGTRHQSLTEHPLSENL